MRQSIPQLAPRSGEALAQDITFGLDQASARPRDAIEPIPPAPARADVHRPLGEQLAGAVRAGTDGTFDIQLSPEELGRVRLTLISGDSEMLVTITAERTDTLDLMRRHIDLLAREFREQGYTSVQFSFEGGGGQERRGSFVPGDHQSAEGAFRNDTSALKDVLPQPQTRPADRLDIRV